MTLCPVMCSNEIKACLNSRLLSAQRSLEHLWTFLAYVPRSSDSRQKSLEVAGMFQEIPVTTR